MKLHKSLGQNFFNNPNLADWIVEKVKDTNPSTIIEIGPGDGYFSKRLIDITKKLILIEKDAELVSFLMQRLPKAEVIEKDILDYEPKMEELKTPISIYGSLPYNISKPIIAKFIQIPGISSMHFIIQKEVAEKYVYADGKSSILSILTTLHAQVKILKIIKPGNFIPKPRVDSALVEITPIDNHSGIIIKKFEEIVKSSFSNPRKTLRNNLKHFDTSGVDKEILDRRAETLSFTEYVGLYQKLVL